MELSTPRQHAVTPLRRPLERGFRLRVQIPVSVKDASLGTSLARKNAEEDDHYSLILARLNDRWRVIRSKQHPFQWILQYREGKRWRGRSWCQQRFALLRSIREKITRPIYRGVKPKAVDPAALRAVEALPDRIG